MKPRRGAFSCLRHRAQFDDDDCNNFRGIACEGHTHPLTHARTHTVYVRICKVANEYLAN